MKKILSAVLVVGAIAAVSAAGFAGAAGAAANNGVSVEPEIVYSYEVDLDTLPKCSEVDSDSCKDCWGETVITEAVDPYVDGEIAYFYEEVDLDTLPKCSEVDPDSGGSCWGETVQD